MLQDILRFVFVIGLVTQAPAQADSCLDRTIPVDVYTERGEAFGPLTAANFQASIGGKPIQVTSATLDSGPRQVLILIDVSGSMIEGGRLNWGLEFVRDLISFAPPQDSLALLTFSNQIEDTLSFGQSRSTLLAEVEKLQRPDLGRVKGVHRTALEDALNSALALQRTPSVGDAFCLVSDGGENASQSHQSRVEALLESAGVRVYPFLPTWHIANRTVTPEEYLGPSVLRDLANATGGTLLMFVPGQARMMSLPPDGYLKVTQSDKEDLASAAQSFHRAVSSFNKLDLKLPEPIAKSYPWKLDVVDASGQRNKHVILVYPQRLAPCTPGEVH